MKNTVIKSILALVMAFMALPMMGQDFMNIYFKDGTFRIFHFNTIVEFFTSPFDSNGVQHMDNKFQHVRTEYEEFVYDINEIDSISFTKYNENVVNEKITAVMDGALPLLADCESIGEAEAMVERLKNLDEVENVWSNGHSINIKIKNWETISFLFNHGLRKKTDSFAQSINMVRSKVSSAMTQMKSNDKMPRIVIASQTHNNMDDETQMYKDSFDSLIKDLKNFGYNSEDIYQPMPSLDFFYDKIYNYDIILLETHGNYDDKGHKLLTGYELGKVRKDNDGDPGKEDKTSWEHNYRKIFNDPKYKNANDHITWDFVPEKRIINGEKKDYWVAYAVVYESFFQKVAKKEFSNKNSVLFNGCCLSLYDNNKLADILREYRKLGTYLGYDAENTYGPISGTHFLRSVLSGISVEKSYDDLKKISISDENEEATLRVSGNCQQEQIDILDGKGNLINSFYSNLNLLPESQQGSSGRFVTPVRTVPIIQEEANSQYNKNQTIIVEGSTINTSTDPSLLKCGFKLYVNETNYGQTPPWTIREIDDIQGDYVSSETNNFIGNLTGLERGKEYSYQAYTFDGKYHNYGETCKLKIEDIPTLTFSENSITLSALTCGSVQITSGSGSYSIESIYPTGIVTASISGNTVTIDALTAGSAKITIKDTKSGETAIIEVTVTGGSPSMDGEIVMERKYYVDSRGDVSTSWEGGRSNNYAYQQISLSFDNNKRLSINYLNAYYWDDSRKTQRKGVYIISYDGGKKVKEWYIQPRKDKEWIKEKIIVSMDGKVSYFSNDTFMGEEIFENLSLDGAKNVTVDLDPYGWWYTHYHYMDDFVITTPATVVKDDFNDGVLDLNIWQSPANPDGVREENGFLKAEQIRTDKDFHLRSKPIPLVGGNGGTEPVSYLTCPDDHHPHLIDLGLPSGTKWACCNVGATTPENYGGYYCWGELEEKAVYNEVTYQYSTGEDTDKDGWYDSNRQYKNIGSDIAGTDFDIVHVKWGGSWVMPSLDQMKELLNNCSSTWTTFKGVSGRKFIGKNNGTIFLPAAGYREGNILDYDGSDGYYWLSTQHPSYSYFASYLFLDSSQARCDDSYFRSLGQSVRPVSR